MPTFVQITGLRAVSGGTHRLRRTTPRLPATAGSEAVVEVGAGMAADLGVAALTSAAGVKTAKEGAYGCVHPFVEIADHVVDRIAPPSTLAALGRSGLAQQRAVLGFHEVESRIEVTARRVVMQNLCGVGFTEDVTPPFLILVAVRELATSLAAASKHPLFEGAQALACVATGELGEVAAEVPAGRDARM